MFESILGGQTKLDKAYAKVDELEIMNKTLMDARDASDRKRTRAMEEAINARRDKDTYKETCDTIGRKYSNCISENTKYLDEIKELKDILEVKDGIIEEWKDINNKVYDEKNELKRGYEAAEEKIAKLEEYLNSLSKVNAVSTKSRKKS